MPRKITSGIVGGPILGNLSSDTNIFSSREANTNIVFTPAGTGVAQFTKDILTSTEAGVRFGDGDTNYALIKAPEALGGNYTLTLPVDNGSANQVLQTDGSGVLSWEASGLNVTDQVADGSVTYYPILTTSTSGIVSEINTSSTKLSYNPSSGDLSVAGSLTSVGLAAGSGNIATTGSLSSGSHSIGTSGSLSFGSSVRQMVNLYGTNYGIGVQSSTQYYRSDSNFAWFRDGVHSDSEFNAGSGGTVVMSLNSSGHLKPGGNGTQDLGGSSNRWRTIYTTDLELSNGIGDYTIVEGEEDLFLYNNKNNKTYKFMIQEVDSTTVPPKDAMNANKE